VTLLVAKSHCKRILFGAIQDRVNLRLDSIAVLALYVLGVIGLVLLPQ
jgi:hypothetical protein